MSSLVVGTLAFVRVIRAPWEDFTPEELTRAADALGYKASFQVATHAPPDWPFEAKEVRFALLILGSYYTHVQIINMPTTTYNYAEMMEATQCRVVWEVLLAANLEKRVLEQARTMFRGRPSGD